jgi:hypothetical protein
MPGGTKTPVEGSPGAALRVVAADVVAEQVVREEDVTAPPVNLGGLGEVDVGVATGLSERLGPAWSEERGLGEVCAGPDPEVPLDVDELVGEQKPGERVKVPGVC